MNDTLLESSLFEGFSKRLAINHAVEGTTMDIVWPLEQDVPFGAPGFFQFKLTNSNSRKVEMSAAEVDFLDRYNHPYRYDVSQDLEDWLTRNGIEYKLVELTGRYTVVFAHNAKPLVTRFYTTHIRFNDPEAAMLFRLTWE